MEHLLFSDPYVLDEAFKGSSAEHDQKMFDKEMSLPLNSNMFCSARQIKLFCILSTSKVGLLLN